MGPFVGPGPDGIAARALREIGPYLFGPTWQTAMAEALEPRHPRGSKVDSAVVRGWVAGRRNVPAWVWEALSEIGQERRSEIAYALDRVRAMIDSGGHEY